MAASARPRAQSRKPTAAPAAGVDVAPVAAALAQLDTVSLPADALEVGIIREPWGLQGWFKVQAYSAEPQALFSSKQWYLQAPQRGARFAGVRLLRVRQAKEQSGTIVACAQGITERDGALALKGARVLVPRSSFPTPAEGEYYWVDLIGATVCNRQQQHLGTLTQLLPTGPQTVLVIERLQQGKTQQTLVPFVSVYVDTVDVAARHITVDWPLEDE